jgi:hypothetical protein
MDKDITKVIEQLIGKPCWRKEVGWMRSLSLGFGNQIHRKTKLIDKFYGEWEIGTYYSAWRIIQGRKILCGRQDAADSIEILNLALNRIELGRFAALQQLTELDVRVEFDSGLAVDFLATTSPDSDNSFHIFCPEKKFIGFSVHGGWKIGPSDQPSGNQ